MKKGCVACAFMDMLFIKKMQKVTDKNKRRTIDKKQSHKNYITIKLNGK